MPKLPKGMFRRKGRPGWYVRLYRSGRERWQSLGTDFAQACDRARALMAGLEVTPSNPGTVGHVAERWLESYVRTQRNEKSRRVAAQRVRDYIDPFFGQQLVGRVTREDVRSFRLWLECQRSPKSPHLRSLKSPHPGDQLTASAADWTMPDLSLSLRR